MKINIYLNFIIGHFFTLSLYLGTIQTPRRTDKKFKNIFSFYLRFLKIITWNLISFDFLLIGSAVGPLWGLLLKHSEAPDLTYWSFPAAVRTAHLYPSAPRRQLSGLCHSQHRRWLKFHTSFKQTLGLTSGYKTYWFINTHAYPQRVKKKRCCISFVKKHPISQWNT